MAEGHVNFWGGPPEGPHEKKREEVLVRANTDPKGDRGEGP